MNIILLEQNNSTFISNIEDDKNFYSLDYISISNNTSKVSNTECISLLNFDIGLLNNSNIEINNAKLIIPLDLIRSDGCLTDKTITLSYNIESFSPETVTWTTKPQAVSYITVPITKKSLRKRHLIIDLSSLLIDWLKNGLRNYGISLSSETPNIMIVLPKNKLNSSPKLIVEYSSNSEEIDDDLSSSPAAIYLQGTNLAGLLLNSNEVIKLNDIKTITPTGISYNSETGIVKIKKIGFYTCHLIINLDGSNDGPESLDYSIKIALKNLTTNNIYDFYMPEVLQGQMVGNCLINVASSSEEFIILNHSSKSLQISAMPLQVSLLISNV